MSDGYWSYVILAATYQQNLIVPFDRVITVFEAHHGVAPDFSRLRMCESTGFALTHLETRRALTSTATRIRLLCYSLNS